MEVGPPRSPFLRVVFFDNVCHQAEIAFNQNILGILIALA